VLEPERVRDLDRYVAADHECELAAVERRGQRERRQHESRRHRLGRAHAHQTGGNRPVALGGMPPVGVDVEGVVQEVGAAGSQTEGPERRQRARQLVGLGQHPGGAGRREHEQVLDPLAGSSRAQQAEGERRRSGGRSVAGR
jgi:hypothetical protein